jgi:RNA polymerase sigma factor (TIGR02999 family)
MWATDLVQESYVKVFGDPSRQWAGRKHFFAVAALAMKSILIDHARSRGRKKRSAEGGRKPLDDLLDEYESRFVDRTVSILDLDEKLHQLKLHDRRAWEVVHLRYFAGLPMQRISEVMGVPKRTVERLWRYAQSWLLSELGGPS